ncbi:hypothetical protein DV737_g1621, partial [Chaetothyriales sp. CBS 132003]
MPSTTASILALNRQAFQIAEAKEANLVLTADSSPDEAAMPDPLLLPLRRGSDRWLEGACRITLGIIDSGLDAIDSGLGTIDSGLGTIDSGLGTIDSGLGTIDSGNVSRHDGKVMAAHRAPGLPCPTVPVVPAAHAGHEEQCSGARIVYGLGVAARRSESRAPALSAPLSTGQGERTKMLETYSPQRHGDSPLHSPHPLRYYDSHPALGEIQRSLSRSPSKNSFRPISPAIGAIHCQSSPHASPSARASADLPFRASPMASPFAARSTPGARSGRQPIRRSAQPAGAFRSRTSPTSPSRRILTSSGNNSGNPAWMPLRKRPSTEAEREQGLKGRDGDHDKENSSSQEEPVAYRTFTRQEKRRSGGGGLSFAAPQSPMKRPEPGMTGDQDGIQSPSAKRRSLHAPGMDFSIFESDTLTSSISQNRSQDDNDWLRTASPATSSKFSTIPKRSSSLRKSTVQQRQPDRPLNLRFNQLLDLESAWLDTTPKSPKAAAACKGLRLSLDNHMDPPPRDSPFSAQGRLLSAFPDDSPTHEPVHRPIRPRSHDFSKSLPVGSSRPSPSDDDAAAAGQPASQASFATPANYKSAKPLPAAFMSTGLISKKNRNVDDANAGLPKAHMPDTPCKKQTTVFPAQAKLKKSILTRSSAFPFTRSGGIFGPRRNRPTLMRKASFASIDSDEKPCQSPSRAAESQSTDSDFPPTPTKDVEAAAGRKASVSPSPHRSRTLSMSRFAPTRGSHHVIITPQADQAASPPTPRDSFFPPDPGALSLAPTTTRAERPKTRNGTPAPVPATPTGPREYFASFSNRASLNLKADGVDADASLTSRFDKVDLVGTGEFSHVYRVSVPPQASPFRRIYAVSTPKPLSTTPPGLRDECVFAVKKSRYPYTGPRDRQRKIQEVDILKALGHADHVIDFVDSWEHDNHLYIQTEFCEEGTLDVFLAHVGLKARLDDFRIWKTLLELSQGLKHIHDAGYIHLDMKPANVLITFDGVLKIADFGMATKWPAHAGIEGEGDREYIGPEVLMGKYDKPADIFALGLIMLEIAGNVELPDNGVSWQKLRSGDMSDVPSLTWSSGVSTSLRGPSANALEGTDVSSGSDLAMDGTDGDGDKDQQARNGELRDPPPFMTDASHPQALDALVKWMISPTPADRPLARDVLLTEGVQFVEARRRAGATVYEGNWGPADEVLAEDAEMIDV